MTLPRWMAIVLQVGQVALRLLFGVMWTMSGFFWIRNGSDGRLAEAIETTLGAQRSFPGYGGFLELCVAPHTTLFTILVTVGETCVGLSLLVGVVTRLGAVGAMFLTLNYALAFGYTLVPPSGNLTLVFIHALLLVGTPGRTLGLDRLLHRRWPGFVLS